MPLLDHFHAPLAPHRHWESFHANWAGAKARLGRSPPAEVRRRLRGFLERYDGPHPSPYQLRCVRGVALLGATGTADARALLAELAKGPADDLLTREARAARR